MGLKVDLTISKHEEPDEATAKKSFSKSLSALDSGSLNDDHPKMFNMHVQSKGKYTRKATYEDISQIAGVPNVTQETLKEWLETYLRINYPERLQMPNHKPDTCWIQDDRNYKTFQTYGWEPIKLKLSTGLVDVKEEWTRQVVLEEFPLDYTTDLEKVLVDLGDKQIVSSLRKSPLKGHPLGVAMMKSNSSITTEFRGLESTVFCLGNNQKAGHVEKESGDTIWTDVKSTRALLQDKKMPKKKGAGHTRTAQIVAKESHLKARVYYRAGFTGTVTTDHGLDGFGGQRYWNWPVKYLLRYSDLPEAAVIYEDVTLHFYTNIEVTMENQDWQWEKSETGRWVKSPEQNTESEDEADETQEEQESQHGSPESSTSAQEDAVQDGDERSQTTKESSLSENEAELGSSNEESDTPRKPQEEPSEYSGSPKKQGPSGDILTKLQDVPFSPTCVAGAFGVARMDE